MTTPIEIRPLTGLPEIAEGAPLGRLLAESAAAAGPAPADGDAVVVSQKVVSKAEGRTRSLAAVEPRAEATELAERLGKDPRLVELVLSESQRIVRAERGVLIVETAGGWICANAGIDGSNVPGTDGVTLLPVDADASARRIRSELEAACGARPAVVIADSFGRPWRVGQVDVAIGCAGLVALDDWRGRTDALGGELAATAIAIADQLAAGADLARVKDSRMPAALATGISRWWTADDGAGARAIQRAAEDDLFR